MSVTIVTGGQFGSEGKGKVAYYFAKNQFAKAAVRVGGTNSGHTVIGNNGEPIILRQLPTAAILPDIYCIISAGSYINIDILFYEMKLTGINKNRLKINPNAMIISDNDIINETNSGLINSIGSTGSGTGAAIQRKLSRYSETKLAKDYNELKEFITPTTKFMRELLNNRHRIIIEGTQGFGLSLLHSDDYPYVTSRDTTASAFLSEAGLSPLDVKDIIMVLRSFPIRVAGTSGPLPKEINWDDLSEIAGTQIREYTSVSNQLRRIAKFDLSVVKQAIDANNPNIFVLNHLDYLNEESQVQLIKYIEGNLNIEINYYGYKK